MCQNCSYYICSHMILLLRCSLILPPRHGVPKSSYIMPTLTAGVKQTKVLLVTGPRGLYQSGLYATFLYATRSKCCLHTCANIEADPILSLGSKAAPAAL